MAWIHADIDGERLDDITLQAVRSMPSRVREVVQTLQEHGHGAWLVGGCVRDVFTNTKTSDFDVATTATPDEVSELFENQTVPTGIEFGTLTLKGDVLVEVTTLRTEGAYRDGRHPDAVQWGTSLLQDLERRDFTMNAMAIDVGLERIYDPFHGRFDVRRGILKGVGDPLQRCNEDVLRVLRAFRFLCPAKGILFQLDQQLSNAIRLTSAKIKDLSVERVWSELKKILDKDKSIAILSHMIDSGVYQHIFSESKPPSQKTLDCIEPMFHQLTTMQKFAVLCTGVEHAQVEAYLLHLKSSNNERKEALQFHSLLGCSPTSSIPSLRIMRHFHPNCMVTLLEIQLAFAREQLQIYGSTFILESNAEHALTIATSLTPRRSSQDSVLTGHDIMTATGIQEGIKLGRLKEWIFKIQIEKDVDSKEQMMHELAQLDWKYLEINDFPRLAINCHPSTS